MFHVSPLKNRFKLRVSDFNKIVEFLNNLCGGLGITIKRPDNPSASNPPMVEIDRKGLATMMQAALTPDVPQNPADHSDPGTVPVQDGDDANPWTWTNTSGGGLVMDAYCLATKPAQNSNYHDLRRVRMTFSKGGLLVKAEMQPDGIRIKA